LDRILQKIAQIEDRRLNLETWVGKTESRSDTVTAAPLALLSATLDRDDPPAREGDAVPLLWHWLYCLPTAKQSELGADGHVRLGGFLPPVPLPRRMYAGGRIEVHQPLRIGDAITRLSRIESITQKEGRNGMLVFVTVRHAITSAEGLVLVEDHDIVYRGAGADGSGQAAPERPAPDDPAWVREVWPDDLLLFRYSALTFNGYRIHYDRRFATEVQGYPGLVVHAPLVATLLADLVRRNRPDMDVRVFSFRAVRPLFDGDVFSVCGRPEADGRTVKLWARDSHGSVAFEASASL